MQKLLCKFEELSTPENQCKFHNEQFSIGSCFTVNISKHLFERKIPQFLSVTIIFAKNLVNIGKKFMIFDIEGHSDKYWLC